MSTEPKLPPFKTSVWGGITDQHLNDWGLQCFEAGRQQGMTQEALRLRDQWELLRNRQALTDALYEELAASSREIEAGPQWQPIETAPRETEILVGRFVNDEWCICQSGYYLDEGDDLEMTRAFWFWYCDHDAGGVTDGEGPTHWMPLPSPPKA